MTKTDDIAIRVRHLIAKVMLRYPEDINMEASLAELHVDSLDRVEIVMDAEEAFSIEISDAEAESVQTVAQLVALIAKLDVESFAARVVPDYVVRGVAASGSASIDLEELQKSVEALKPGAGEALMKWLAGQNGEFPKTALRAKIVELVNA